LFDTGININYFNINNCNVKVLWYIKVLEDAYGKPLAH